MMYNKDESVINKDKVRLRVKWIMIIFVIGQTIYFKLKIRKIRGTSIIHSNSPS